MSALLVFALSQSVVPANAFAAGEDAVVVISASDDQQNGAAPKTNTDNILAQIQKDYPTADGFLAGGDYSQSMSTSATTFAQNEIQGIHQSDYGTSLHEIHVQGNNALTRRLRMVRGPLPLPTLSVRWAGPFRIV